MPGVLDAAREVISRSRCSAAALGLEVSKGEEEELLPGPQIPVLPSWIHRVGPCNSWYSRTRSSTCSRFFMGKIMTTVDARGSGVSDCLVTGSVS